MCNCESFARGRRWPTALLSGGWALVLAAAAVAAVAAVAAAAVAAVAAESSPGAQTLVDFENAAAVKLVGAQAEATLVPRAGGQALQIATEENAPWPGVSIERREGRWDLSAFDAVEMDIDNPQDVPVRVLLSVNAPGADGQRNCSVASANVPAHGRATLEVPFGVWHGETNRPIDVKNIVAFQVMLDRPKRSHRFLVDDIRAITYGTGPTQEVVGDPFFRQLNPAFGRGINLGNALEAPKEGEWGVVLKEEYFEKIRAAGFDSVRIPVRWSAHAETAAPYAIDPKFLDRADWAVRQALGHKLTAVLNMHHYEEIFKKPDEHRERFLALWRQIAERYKDYPAELAFELLNEPHDKLSAEKWNRLLADGIEVVRRTNPTRTIVVGPVGWNSINDLGSLELPPGDRHLVVTVHYYSPFQFTHQGAHWVGGQSQKWLGTTWTGTKAEEQAVRRDLDKAIAWAVKHKRSLYLGEFGAYSKADMESRARWTRFVAEEAWRRKIGYAYWEFCSGFGAYDAGRGQWNEPLKKALVPAR